MLLKGISPIQKQDNRTKDMNPIFNIIKGLSDNYEDDKKEKVSISTDLSSKVAGVGLEPTTSGL